MITDCRRCKFFHRVYENNYKNIYNVRGFCSLGRLMGDFSLYTNVQFDEPCQAFVLDEYNNETWERERKIEKAYIKFRFDIVDGRTAIHKLIKKHGFNNKEFERFFKKDINDRWVALHVNRKLLDSMYELFVRLHKDDFDWLYNRKMLKKNDYISFLNELRTRFSNFVDSKEAKE